MGLSKRLKRKTEVTKNKAEEKEKAKRTKLAVTEVVAEESGRLTLLKNRQRIQDFCNTYMRVITDYVLNKTFGFGAQRIEKIRQQMKEFFWMLNPNDSNNPHPHWLDAEDLRSGFLEDCGYEFPYRERWVNTDHKTDALKWCSVKAQNASMQVADDYECVLLWVLHTKWGFGKQRLAKCSVAIRAVDDMPSKLFNMMVDELESRLKRKYDDVRMVMESLTVDGVHPCEGFTMI